MKYSYEKVLLLSVAVFAPFLLTSCSPPEVNTISCKTTSIVSRSQDGTNVSTPQSALGKEDFTWFRKENKVEVKVMGSFDAEGNYKEAIQKVPSILENNILSFNTKSSGVSGVISGRSYQINLTSKTYSSDDLEWETSPDGSFKIASKGTCII